MDEINVRFIELRRACDKNQTEWGKIIGVSRSGIASIETGQRKVTEKHLIMLSNWKECRINIQILKF